MRRRFKEETLEKKATAGNKAPRTAMHWGVRACDGSAGNARSNSFVAAFYEPCIATRFRLSGSAQEAEDLTQETFCQAQNKLEQLRDEIEPRPGCSAS